MGAKKFRAGFVMSLIVVSLITLLIILSTSLHDSYLSLERALKEPQPLMYSAFLFDDVGYDLNEIVGPSIRLYEKNDSSLIVISDSIPKQSFSSNLIAYENFLESNISQEIHAEIEADFGELTNGTLNVYINEDYLYQSRYNESNEVLFKNITNSTAPLSYKINITASEYRKNVQEFEWDNGETGAINVTLVYTDLNGTMIASGQLDPQEENYFKIEYEKSEAQVEIEIGELGENGEESGALWLKAQNTTVGFSIEIELPLQDASKRVGYSYDAMLNYTQNDVFKSDYIRR